MTLRLLAALALGGLIGLEREYRSKDAGFRTHFLVALGSALFCIVSQFGFGDGVKDTSRVAAQVVSGIGFIGAGTIIFQKNVVRGLTTAAGLWVTAAIGLACGTAMYIEAVIATALVLIGLEVLNAFIPQIAMMKVALSFTATSKESVQQVMDKFKNDSVEILSYELKSRSTAQGELFDANLEIKVKRGGHNERLLDYLSGFDDVSVSNIE